MTTYATINLLSYHQGRHILVVLAGMADPFPPPSQGKTRHLTNHNMPYVTCYQTDEVCMGKTTILSMSIFGTRWTCFHPSKSSMMEKIGPHVFIPSINHLTHLPKMIAIRWRVFLGETKLSGDLKEASFKHEA